MAKLPAIACLVFGLVLLANASRDIEVGNKGVMNTIEEPSMELVTTIHEPPQHGLGGSYCCIKNFQGCVQECDSNAEYECCVKNGYGCHQMCDKSKDYVCCRENKFGCGQRCESGHEYYCCKYNKIAGCLNMCPKVTNNLMLEQVV
ncbi:uncharacterized protein LOC9654180 [Selaginella moellendorffii]|uniref:uncharacterized protein LOC9654180 n=1 Tax=Selaginella moellendorffii TaxID=88036 RepID=UPI000D1CC419|nr:uncharacterized protein LOC9654180 [Selaginella moellendorffii]|eukprot:XP_024543843.1 uncharacterized protein LOC9654180 [Selaginella moellendorffii]